MTAAQEDALAEIVKSCMHHIFCLGNNTYENNASVLISDPFSLLTVMVTNSDKTHRAFDFSSGAQVRKISVKTG